VYPVTSSQSGSDERRRNPRHRASSIVYAQLGSDNGGIVVNLGIDGVAFHAAREVTAEKNSSLNLRLRGSGLNVELTGELVWLGATQKEAGICFKSLSAKAERDIADWIAREAQLFETVPMEDRSRPAPMPAMPGISTTQQRSLSHSLFATLGIPQAIPADTPSIADADADEPYLQAPLDSVPGISAATLLPEIVSPIQSGHVPADELDDVPHAPSADPSASPEQSLAAQPMHDEALFEPVPIERPYQFPTGSSSPVVRSEEPAPATREELPEAAAELPGKNELYRTEETEPISGVRVSRPADSLLGASAAEKWIPPVLLFAWRRGNPQRKLLLAGTGTACLVIFALILTLAVAHVDSSLSRPAVSGPVQQPMTQVPMALESTATPAASVVAVDTPQTDPLQATPMPPASLPRRSHKPPPPSLFENFATALGFGPDKTDEKPVLDEDQVGVQVWTSKSSGYYYCTDDPYYKTVQPGTFMSQGDALQSGYRSIIGQFCD